MNDESTTMRELFVSRLADQGSLKDPFLRTAFREVPRHTFLPRFFIQETDGRWRAIDSSHPQYLPLVYADTTLTTQVNGDTDPDPAAEPIAGDGTSSSTQPSLMAYMLDALGLAGSDQVLEIGTGTGYNAALLSHRLDEELVTTIEVDPHVAELARDRLKACGYAPTVEVADGATGWQGGAPYDHVIATVSFPFVPRAWIDQTRNGGAIVTSLWRDLGGGPLVRLTVNDGVAEGRFLTMAGGFMPTRGVARTEESLATALRQTGQSRDARVGSTVLHEASAGLWIALLVPNATWIGFTPEGEADQLWLFSSDGSWSCLEDDAMKVEQYGTRRVWDEIEAAHQSWLDAGSPSRERVGLTVTREGMHRFWLDDPDHVLWTSRAPH
ncbi:ATP-grasp peptide maturase system methyltransferase [Krasilnikovia sp. M28-CT-15]|uniref:ATP-grasp peptide maturase system methyltransferase n=1 Tax=Krasilnikovia sp. M28-CT-15 TaxID=3373540 RepID=UPI00387659D4